jgi:predicted AlkP superfamily phosphohydrolase/phosphomutase
VLIRDWGTHDPEDPPSSRPAALVAELTRRFGGDPVGCCDRGRDGAAALAGLRDDLLERVRRKTALSEELLGRGGWDLFLTVFSESHCAGHQFWHVHDPQHERHRRDLAGALGDPLRDVYVGLDAAVGRLLDVAGPDTTVLLLASHGMGAHHDGTYLLDEILRRIDGVPPDRGAAAIEAARRLWHRAPASVRRPLQKLADRSYHAARSRSPASRRFFAVPTNENCGGIRVNVVGREPRGKVARGAALDAVCAQLTTELLALVDVASGQPVVREVLRSADVFPGERLDDLPDLLVRWHRHAPIRGVTSSRVGRVERADPGVRSGDHRAAGALLARRPGLGPGSRAEAVSIVDVAPTIAALLGVALDDVDGQPIAEIVGA